MPAPDPTPDVDPGSTPEAAKARFRRTLVHVLIVQAVAFVLLGAIQILYNV